MEEYLAARDEQLRARFAAGLEALRATFAQFAADSAADAGLPVAPERDAELREAMADPDAR